MGQNQFQYTLLQETPVRAMDPRRLGPHIAVGGRLRKYGGVRKFLYIANFVTLYFLNLNGFL